MLSFSMAATNTGVVPTELVVGSLKLQKHEVLLELEIVKSLRKRGRVVRGNTNELEPTAVDGKKK